jgi:hypothetical protein
MFFCKRTPTTYFLFSSSLLCRLEVRNIKLILTSYASLYYSFISMSMNVFSIAYPSRSDSCGYTPQRGWRSISDN